MSNNVENQNFERIEKIVSKNKRKLFWYLIMVVLLFVLVFILYFKYVSEQKKVVFINEENNKNVAELSKLKNKTFSDIEHLTKIIDSLATKNDSLLKQLSSTKNIKVDKTLIYKQLKNRVEIKLIKNSEYLIGAHSYNTTKEEDAKIARFLMKEGYTLEGDRFMNYDNYRPKWMSNSPTVFYYSESSKYKADNIAQQLTRLTRKPFKTERGAGLGVIKGQEAVTFFIHNVPKK